MTIRQYLIERSTPKFTDAIAGYIEGEYTSREAGEILGTSHQLVINRTATLFRELVKKKMITLKEADSE